MGEPGRRARAFLLLHADPDRHVDAVHCHHLVHGHHLHFAVVDHGLRRQAPSSRHPYGRYFEDKIVQPSAVSEVEATVAPVVAVEPKREAREAQYYPEYFYPQMMPSYLQAPYVPKFNPFYAAMVNPFR